MFDILRRFEFTVWVCRIGRLKSSRLDCNEFTHVYNVHELLIHATTWTHQVP
jgi:hypothetical protein